MVSNSCKRELCEDYAYLKGHLQGFSKLMTKINYLKFLIKKSSIFSGLNS